MPPSIGCAQPLISPDLSGTRYELVEKLGEGGMGGVYRVADTELGRQVALKVIRVVDSSWRICGPAIARGKNHCPA